MLSHAMLSYLMLCYICVYIIFIYACCATQGNRIKIPPTCFFLSIYHWPIIGRGMTTARGQEMSPRDRVCLKIGHPWFITIFMCIIYIYMYHRYGIWIWHFFWGDIPSSIAVYSSLPETFDGVKTTQVPGEKTGQSGDDPCTVQMYGAQDGDGL